MITIDLDSKVTLITGSSRGIGRHRLCVRRGGKRSSARRARSRSSSRFGRQRFGRPQSTPSESRGRRDLVGADDQDVQVPQMSGLDRPLGGSNASGEPLTPTPTVPLALTAAMPPPELTVGELPIASLSPAGGVGQWLGFWPRRDEGHLLPIPHLIPPGGTHEGDTFRARIKASRVPCPAFAVVSRGAAQGKRPWSR